MTFWGGIVSHSVVPSYRYHIENTAAHPCMHMNTNLYALINGCRMISIHSNFMFSMVSKTSSGAFDTSPATMLMNGIVVSASRYRYSLQCPRVRQHGYCVAWKVLAYYMCVWDTIGQISAKCQASQPKYLRHCRSFSFSEFACIDAQHGYGGWIERREGWEKSGH